LAGMSILRVTMPEMAFGQSDEEVIPWIDRPESPPPGFDFNLQPWENLVDSWLTPIDRFFTVYHYDQPQNLDEGSWRLDITGLVARPMSLTVADLKARERRELDFTLECSGDNGFNWFTSAVANGHWAGTPLASVLEEAGVLEHGIEVVFYGVDSGTVTIRDNGGVLGPGQTGNVKDDGEGGLDLTITEQFARSMSIRDAFHRDNLLCYELNGEPLAPVRGFPLRLIAPGWFGVANVKWLTRIEVRDQRYANRFMARDYVSIREEQRAGQTVWTFSTVGPFRLKSAPGHVARRANGHYAIKGAAWGAPIAAVQVQIDDGPWLEAILERPAARNHRGYSWRFWRLNWDVPTRGEHTVRSRAIDINGNIQPAPDDPFLSSKVTYWESNGQITRRVRIP
jgi:DMSO/TMAO reductase YedYZ molybdopterin-dependent catalytic subunit